MPAHLLSARMYCTSSPYGPMAFAWSGKKIIALQVGEEACERIRAESRCWGYECTEGLDNSGNRILQEMEEYFAGKRKKFTVTPEFHGTEFQKRVWQELMTVPYGSLLTYRQLAAMADRPLAARAVGGVMAKNRIAIVVPCHRVVASQGHLGGYGYGLDMKRSLLQLENAAV